MSYLGSVRPNNSSVQSWESPTPNNYSLRQLASSPTEQRTKKARQKPVRRSRHTEQCPKVRVRSPILEVRPRRKTEHTKCFCYFAGITLSCSISNGSLWDFVATFMRFCAMSWNSCSFANISSLVILSVRSCST